MRINKKVAVAKDARPFAAFEKTIGMKKSAKKRTFL